MTLDDVWKYLRALDDQEFDQVMEDIAERKTIMSRQQECFMGRAKTSQYLGVSRKRQRWAVEVWANGVRHYIGLFKWEKQAARAYDEAARRLQGSGAKFNFPRPGERWCGPATHWRGGYDSPSKFDLGLPVRDPRGRHRRTLIRPATVTRRKTR